MWRRYEWESVEQFIERMHNDFYWYYGANRGKFRFEEKRYIVTKSSSQGAHRPEDGDTVVTAYAGDDFEIAVNICNAIDKYRDTWFEKVDLPMDAVSLAERKFDALTEFILAGGFG